MLVNHLKLKPSCLLSLVQEEIPGFAFSVRNFFYSVFPEPWQVLELIIISKINSFILILSEAL